MLRELDLAETGVADRIGHTYLGASKPWTLAAPRSQTRLFPTSRSCRTWLCVSFANKEYTASGIVALRPAETRHEYCLGGFRERIFREQGSGSTVRGGFTAMTIRTRGQSNQFRTGCPGRFPPGAPTDPGRIKGDRRIYDEDGGW